MGETEQGAVVEDPTETPEQTEQTQEQEASAEESPEAPPEPEKAKPANELKVVIIMRDNRIMLGVQSPDCDPVYETLEGTLAAALKRVPKLVEEAKARWETSKLNPKCETPLPQEQPAVTSRPQKAAASKAQPTMF